MAFPQSPLDVRVDLAVAGVDTDVTADVLLRDRIAITYGKPDEGTRTDPGKCVLSFNNKNGKYSPRNPMSPYYGKIGRNTRVRVSVPAASSYAYLPDRSDETPTISTPDVAALDITGDIDIRIDAQLDNWNPVGSDVIELAGKFALTSNQRSWYVVLAPNGGLRIAWSTDGTSANGFNWASNPLPVPSSGRLAVRVTLDVDNGTGGWAVSYYTAPTLAIGNAGGWTLLESHSQNTGVTSIFNSTAPLEVGNITSVDDATFGFQHAQGRIYGFELRNGINGTVVASPNFATQTVGATSFVDSAGRTWILGGTAKIDNRDYRFTGEISSWPPKWDVSGKDAWTPVEASGIQRRLGQGARALQSALRRRVPTFSPLAYWPMEEGSDSDRAYSPIKGVKPMVTSGLQFAQDSTLASSNPLPTLNSNSGSILTAFRGTVPAPAAAITGWQVRWLYRLDTVNTTLRTFLRVISTGTVAEWLVQWRNDLTRVLAVDSDGNTVFQNDFTTGTDLYNQWNETRLYTQQVGGTVNWFLTWQDIGGDFGTVSGSFTGTIGRPTAVTQPGSGFSTDLDGMAIGHISAWGTTGTTAYVGAVSAYAKETAGDRMLRLSDEEGVPVFVLGNRFGQQPMGTQKPDTLLNLLGDAATADGGILYEPRDRIALRYRDRASLYNQPVGLTLNYATTGHVAPDLEPVDDDQGSANDVTASRVDGSSARITDDTSSMGTQPPPVGIGVAPGDITVNVATDEQLDDIASWLVRLGTWDEARVPVVSVDLAAAPSLIAAVTGLTLGDRIRITNPPVWMGPDAVDLIVQGYTENIGLYDWDFSFNCTPAGPWTVAVRDDTTLGRRSSLGSSLASGVTSSATSLSVATPTGGLWTTQAGDFPFNIEAGGEVMTVTNITGSSSPQTFTVTRSINGIVKAQTANTALVLAQPAARAL